MALRSKSADHLQRAEKTVDPVSIYLREISKTPLLSMEEEQELAFRIGEGVAANRQLAEFALRDPDTLTEDELDQVDLLELAVLRAQRAHDQLTQGNLRLVVSVAKRYLGRGLSLLDLIQEGNLGLLHAVDKFDPTLGYRFSTYATWWIRQAISRSIADKARTIRLPVHVIENVNRQNRVQRELAQQLGREPTPAEIAVEMELLNRQALDLVEDGLADGGEAPEVEEADAVKDVKRASGRVRELQRLNMEPLSLDSPLEGEEQSSLADFIVDEGLVDPAAMTDRQSLVEQIEELLLELTDRERDVLIMRFGLDGDTARTLEEIGNGLNITRERVRQIQAKAIRKLRAPQMCSRLNDFATA